MNDFSGGIVYVVTNPAMPGLVKIGKTTQNDANSRVSQLYTTGVPVPFDIEYACKVTNPTEVEQALHLAFAPQRINPRREFFRIDPEQAIAILSLLNVEDATNELIADSEGIEESDKESSAKLKSRRPNLNFEEMGIPIGSVIHAVRTEDIATIVSPTKVEFRDFPEISLTAATRLVLGLEYSVSPTHHWTYNDVSLQTLYDETYAL